MAKVDLGQIPTLTTAQVTAAVNAAVNKGMENLTFSSTDDGKLVVNVPEPFVE